MKQIDQLSFQRAQRKVDPFHLLYEQSIFRSENAMKACIIDRVIEFTNCDPKSLVRFLHRRYFVQPY